MNDQYELYCLADPLFYDTLDGSRGGHPDFPLASREVPDGWTHQATDTWMHYAPAEGTVPPQGWKIHVSACVEDAERAMEAVWDYCVPRDIPFKFLRSRPVMTMLNSKAAARGSSGKLVTVYPLDDSQLELTLKELDILLRGVRGPYILSDLRYGEGPLFVRYGGFVPRHCTGDNGELVLALEDGDGNLVPDVRGPSFSLPSWVTLPAFLEPHLAARNAVTTAGLPYEIESVIQFSNGGGVYLGRDARTDRRVVLKEARPYAGLDTMDRDAVTRLAHERDMLERLSGLDAVPALVDYFTLGDHHFLVQEFVDGNPLQRLLVQKYPLTRASCGPRELADYTAWVLDVLPKVRAAVESLHGRGVVFGDLHPNNILVTAEGRMVLIDYEVATLAENRERATLGHPAFAAPRDRHGLETDAYALACLCIGLFAPQLMIMQMLDRGKAAQLAGLIKEAFPVPPEVVDDAVRTITGTEPVASRPAPRPGHDAWPEVRDAMVRAILASATPDRDDRLFPGDPAQFEPGGGLTFAHGAAGVLYALDAAGAGRLPEHEEWLRRRARDLERGARIGFYDGLHGVAHVLDLLGHRQDALDIVDRCLREKWELLDTGLFGGLAGIGLNLFHLARTTGERALSDTALRAAGICADRLGGPDDVPELSGGTGPRAGLMYGSAGSALLFLHAYEHTGDAALLEHAAVALRQDLRRCRTTQDGTLQVDQGWRTLPYLDEGSVGIGLVLARYLAHRDDEGFAAALDACRLVTRGGFFVQPGLFTGRAGMIAALGGGLGPFPDGPGTDLAEQIRGLAWHALSHGDGLAFPGDQLLRLSMDFATGTAGVLFAMSTALNDRPVFLPFIQPPGGAGAMATASPAHEPAERSHPDESPKEV
ncbi:serine/threonine protein kinase [Planomonospora parontospora subsp. parontospora]|uniref:non-specific serine/threonine protein kinase n=2 Tax=Planomonospora parontospora TaxID=58119 RepID=A0AA37BJ89_9ACTN|nr:class III lanthionine synthetase LanKC [Planomonospora parontospora]GGK78662.1 serine/threonine protein kinase [Planomonospora parontospora]GII10295.1 serine/threonine protein kinase [Planomonospora parontospora subsp. parontospora]